MWSDFYLSLELGNTWKHVQHRLGKDQGWGLFNVFFQSDICWMIQNKLVAQTKVILQALFRN